MAAFRLMPAMPAAMTGQGPVQVETGSGAWFPDAERPVVLVASVYLQPSLAALVGVAERSWGTLACPSIRGPSSFISLWRGCAAASVNAPAPFLAAKELLPRSWCSSKASQIPQERPICRATFLTWPDPCQKARMKFVAMQQPLWAGIREASHWCFRSYQQPVKSSASAFIREIPRFDPTSASLPFNFNFLVVSHCELSNLTMPAILFCSS